VQQAGKLSLLVERRRRMLEIEQLSVAIDDKQILHDVNLTIKGGEISVLFGPNGSGKTTLLMTIMGFPRYHVTNGRIVFMGKNITTLSLDERARMGIGMSFQRPPVVRGVRTRDMVLACLGERGNGQTISRLANRADMSGFLERDINLGFSGGEIKRSELLQLMAQKPHLALLDEPESGVDLVNIALIGELITELLVEDCPVRSKRCTGLIITHTGHILDYVMANTGYVMCEGTIYCQGNPQEILKTIKEKGYKACVSCSARRMPNG
jgi:Fe-S cluster assembly ATP-binding protein